MMSQLINHPRTISELIVVFQGEIQLVLQDIYCIIKMKEVYGFTRKLLLIVRSKEKGTGGKTVYISRCKELDRGKTKENFFNQ